MQGSLDDNNRKLQTSKWSYAVQKDDICVGLGRPLYGSSINNTRRKAYPSIISNVGDMHKFVQKWIAVHNFLVQDYHQSVPLKEEFLSKINGQNIDLKLDNITKNHVKSAIDNMLEFYFMGVSLGLAYAHPHSGDTVCSVMVGGLKTVLNGGFQVHTGDLLMFYLDSELSLFDEDGGRKDRKHLLDNNQLIPGGNVNWQHVISWMNDDKIPDAGSAMDGPFKRQRTERKEYHEMQNGNFAKGPNGPITGKVGIFRIKPYRVSRYPDMTKSTGGTIVPQHFPCDACRIFGRALSNARPYDFVDVQLSRQSY